MADNNRRFTSFRIPLGGWYCLGVAAPLLVLGLSRHINLLMLLSYVLVVMMLCNLLAAGRTLRGLQARLRFGEWLFARTPCVVEVQVSNPDRQARLGLRFDAQDPESAATCQVDCLPGQGSVSWRRQMVLPRRGRFAWGAVRASSGYPFGLVERRRLLTAEETVTVLPCLGWLHRGRFLRHLRDLSAPLRQTHLRHKPLPHPAAQAEFHGLRSYRSGDSPRLIHWRTSARRGELMVREFEDEPSENLLLVVDPVLPPPSSPPNMGGELRNSPPNMGGELGNSPPNMGGELGNSPPILGGDEGGGGASLHEQFEEMVSLIASICWEWCRRRDDRLVLAAAAPAPVLLDGLTGPAHARRILECLAVLECRPGPADASVIQRLQEWRLPAANVVVTALGRSALVEPLQRALGRRVHSLDATHTDRFDFYKPPN